MNAPTAQPPSRLRRRLGRYKRAVLRRIAPPPPPAKKKKKAAPRKAAQAVVDTQPAPNPTPAERLELRRRCVFATADPRGRILEIGAAHNGILPKREGFGTKIVDHLDRDGLVAKYSGFAQYSADDIEEVDFVLTSGAGLADVIREEFDLVLASHVLEHTPSLVHFLNDAATLLAPGGVLALVVPDHRYCFDRFRERSSVGRVIDTYYSGPTVHTAGTLIEFGLDAVKHRGSTSWVRNHRGRYSMVHSLAQAQALGAKASGEAYVDVHNWVFSPNHLRLLIHDLHALGLITLQEAFFHDTVGHEFFLNLTVEGSGSGLSREELLVLADDERRSLDVPVFVPPAGAEADATGE